MPYCSVAPSCVLYPNNLSFYVCLMLGLRHHYINPTPFPPHTHVLLLAQKQHHNPPAFTANDNMVSHHAHLGEVARRVGVDALEQGELVGDELQGQHADESRQAVVGGDHDRVFVQAFREL